RPVLALTKVIPSKKLEINSASRVRALLTQRFDGQAKEVSHPLALEVVFDRFAVWNLVLPELAFRCFEIQRYRHAFPAALLATSRFLLIDHEALEASSQVGAKRSYGGIITEKEILLERSRKETLSQ